MSATKVSMQCFVLHTYIEAELHVSLGDLRYGAPFQRVMTVLRDAMRFPPVKLHYMDDDDFMAYFEGDFLQSLPQIAQAQPPPTTTAQASSQLPRQTSEVIDLLDDDDD